MDERAQGGTFDGKTLLWAVRPSFEQIVILVRLERGFLVDAGELSASKGDITKPPE